MCGGSRILRVGGSGGCECEAHCCGGERTRVPSRPEPVVAQRPPPETETDSPPALTVIYAFCHSFQFRSIKP
ncbi:unnamed protein product [Prunus armeniaca]|uniref:Uncharacterized protein n=1 Tax=Prunus armeniaca TaxID=36596 RepID=A0A6J5Y334_PRUAR|nr:unnamed protein product [Prunus armeniaca]CAB4318883.1 unnamed protein product [Prunus armeniaca]